MIIFKYHRQKSSAFGDILRPIAEVMLEFHGNKMDLGVFFKGVH